MKIKNAVVTCSLLFLTFGLIACSGDSSGESSDEIPRLVINGTSHEIAEDSCDISDEKIHVNVEAVDYDETEYGMRFWITPPEDRAEIGIDQGADAPSVNGHADWDAEGSGSFEGGLETSFVDDVLTVEGTFDSSTLDHDPIDLDVVIDCS